jgi:N-methylhydantoinase B
VAEDTITAAEAAEAYGVVLVGGRPDMAATNQMRSERRRARLRDAEAPRRAMQGAVLEDPEGAPMYPGVVQRGRFAVAEKSAAVLAESPDHWTDGCPILVERRPGPGETDLLVRTYLDPMTGVALYVEVCPDNEPRSFEISPAHWVNAS